MANFTRVNYKIRAAQVRVLDATGSMIGVMPLQQALRLAEQEGLDLVEITPNAVPPVCKVMDYGKFKYDESIKAKQARKAQKVVQVKEIKFHPGTDVGDLEHKLRQIRQFLGEGAKVKLTLQFRGRENAHRELGEDMISKVLQMLEGECFVEQAPKTLGRVHGCLIGPPRQNKGGKKQQAQQAGEQAPGPDDGVKITIG